METCGDRLMVKPHFKSQIGVNLMTPEERQSVKQSAADNHGGDLTAAACEYVGCLTEYQNADKQVPDSHTMTVRAVVAEVEAYDDQAG